MAKVNSITGQKFVDGGGVVRFGVPTQNYRRVVSFQDASYICQIADGAAAGNGLLENLADSANLAEINNSVVVLNNFATGLDQAVVTAHFNPSINTPESWAVLCVLNAVDNAAAVNALTVPIAIGDDTAVGNADANTARVGATDIGYDLLSPTAPALHYDLRGVDGGEIVSIHLLAVDSVGASAEVDLVVTARVF